MYQEKKVSMQLLVEMMKTAQMAKRPVLFQYQAQSLCSHIAWGHEAFQHTNNFMNLVINIKLALKVGFPNSLTPKQGMPVAFDTDISISISLLCNFAIGLYPRYIAVAISPITLQRHRPPMML